MSERASESESTARHTTELLHSFPLFEELNDEQLEWVAERAEEITVPAGTRLFEAGDRTDGFLVLIKSELELRHRIDNHERVAIRGSTPAFGRVRRRSNPGSRSTRSSRTWARWPPAWPTS